MSEKLDTKTLIGIISAIFIIAIVSGFFGFGKPDVDVTETSVTEETVAVDVIEVADQEVGDTIVVASATFTQNGFVVIYEDMDGLPSVKVGNSELINGTSRDIVISLDRATVPGERFWAVLYSDNGDQIFSTDDSIVSSSDNKIETALFAITQ